MEYPGMKWVMEELRYWVERIAGWNKKLETEEEEALTAFLDALNETTIYLGRINGNPAASTREKEEELSRLWRYAAQKVRHYNDELAQRCISKATYWATPFHWSPREIEEMQISIKEIMVFANRALRRA